MHLVIDGFKANPQKLQDLELVYQILDDYPDSIQMTKIIPPYVFRYHGKKEEDWGISGFVLIAESHISIHTFPEKQYVNIDIFSCKEFDAEQAMRYVQEKFELGQVHSTIMERGLEYSFDVDRAKSIVVDERTQLLKTGTS